MHLPWHTLLELGSIALALSFSLWVLVAQPLALVRTMPRERFLPLQMKVVRAWIRVVAALLVVAAVTAVMRVGVSARLAPALLASAAAITAAVWAVPRALRAGGASMRDDGDEAFDAASFLSEGGGGSTRVWHRVVLLCVALMFGGAIVDAHAAVSPAPHASCCQGGHEHEAVARQREPTTQGHDQHVAVDAVTGQAIDRFEREVAALVASGGDADTRPMRLAWNQIFATCRMQGEAHERLHAFLFPMVPELGRIEAASGAARLPALRSLLGRLSTR